MITTVWLLYTLCTEAYDEYFDTEMKFNRVSVRYLTNREKYLNIKRAILMTTCIMSVMRDIK